MEEVQQLESEQNELGLALPESERSIGRPLFDATPQGVAYSRKGTRSALDLGSNATTGSSSSIETRSSDMPRALRSGSLAGTSPPVVSTDITNADAFKQSTPPDHSHAASAMAAMSALSQTTPSRSTPVGSPSRPSRIEKSGSQSSASSRDSLRLEKDSNDELTPQASSNISGLVAGPISNSYPSSPVSVSNASFKSDALSSKSSAGFASFGQDSRRETSTSSSSGKSSVAETKRLSLASVTSAASTAKKWGWEALQRRRDQRNDSSFGETTETSHQPIVMGRGRPLPPPGTPLPPPDRKTRTAPIPVPKRKPIPPPELSEKSKDIETHTQRHKIPPPLLPKRRGQANHDNEQVDDGLFVVEAPHGDSEPTTPMSESTPPYIAPWVEEDTVEGSHTSDPPRLPKRRLPHRVLSSSPVEDGPELPSWMAAQEEEARARSNFVDEDMGV